MKSKTTLLTQICQIALITGMLLSTSMLSAQSMQDTVIANFSLLISTWTNHFTVPERKSGSKAT